MIFKKNKNRYNKMIFKKNVVVKKYKIQNLRIN